MTPMSNAKQKPLIDSPPKMNIASNTTKVVIEVLIVRPTVLFTAELITDFLSRFG